VDFTKLATIVSFIGALSVASERLVEIIKGLVPWLDQANADEMKEGRRRSVLHLLAVGAGVLTAALAADYIPAEVANPSKSWAVIGLGVLASGGSGLWNSVLTYVAKVKDIKKAEADLKMSAAVQAKSPVKP
jgi:O-antigen/teichoic acid export membrane protein